MAKKGEHTHTKDTPASPMGKWRRKNSGKYQQWRKTYKQTNKSNSRNKARRIIETSGRAKKCAKCGQNPGSRKLEVHHKNGKVMDNRLSNLEYRCAKCNPRGVGAKEKT